MLTQTVIFYNVTLYEITYAFFFFFVFFLASVLSFILFYSEKYFLSSKLFLFHVPCLVRKYAIMSLHEFISFLSWNTNLTTYTPSIFCQAFIKTSKICNTLQAPLYLRNDLRVSNSPSLLFLCP